MWSAQGPCQGLRHAAQAGIPLIVTKVMVVVREVIHIDHHQRQGAAVALAVAHLAGDGGIEAV